MIDIYEFANWYCMGCSHKLLNNNCCLCESIQKLRDYATFKGESEFSSDTLIHDVFNNDVLSHIAKDLKEFEGALNP